MASGEKIRILVSSDKDQRTIQLFLHYCELVEKCDIETTNDVVTSLQSNGFHLEGLSTICRHLVLTSTNSVTKQLLSDEPEIAAQISEWVNFFLTDRNPSGDNHLRTLNNHLEDKNYLVGNCLTLADLIIFAELYSVAEMLPTAQYNEFCNIIRWHSFVHGMTNCNELFPPIKRKLPMFDFTPPVEAALEKGKQGEGTDSGEAADEEPTDEGESSKEAKKKLKEAKKAAKDLEKQAKKEVKKLKNTEKKLDKETKEPEKEEKKLDKEAKKLEKAEKKKSKEEKKENKTEVTIDALDLKIGQIVSIKHHLNADALYIEEIDVGEDKPRQIISGLVKFVSLEAMQNRKVVICCNLKPAKLKGEKSYGMVMCSSDSAREKVDPLIPPEGSTIGEKVTFEGYSADPVDEIKPKQKILESLFPDLVTDAEGIAKYKDTPFMTSNGPITSSITNGHIS